jgi:hypothetical protein
MDQELSQKLGEMQIQWSAGFDSLQVVWNIIIQLKSTIIF